MFDQVAWRKELCCSIEGWSADQLGEALRDLAALRGALEACEVRVLAAFTAARGHEASGAVDASAWLRVNTGTSHREAGRRMAVARDLGSAPVALSALADGRVTFEHAAALAKAARQHHHVREGVDELLATAASEPADAFASTLRAWIAEHRPEDAPGDDHHANRRLSMFVTDEGMTGFDVRLESAPGAGVLTAIDRVAEQLWQDGARDASLAQRRADALVQLCRGTAGGAQSVDVVVLIDHQTLLGQLAAVPICELADGTPLAPATARRLACDAGILPMVLNGEGRPLDLGRKQRSPSGAQRRALLVRDGGCVFPGCDRPPGWCDAHHLREWDADDGPTDLANLVLLCEAHHHHVHEGGWRLNRAPEGTVTVTSPTGVVHQDLALRRTAQRQAVSAGAPP